jgi:hypothetical protein
MLIGGEQRRRLSPSAPFTPCPSRVRVSRPTVSEADRVAALSSRFRFGTIYMSRSPRLRRGCGKIVR